MRSMTMAIARGVSTIGHPLLVVPAAVLAVLLYRQTASAASILAPVCGICAVAFTFSFWQVRRGRWQHIDASLKAERSSLNLFLASVLLLGAVIGFYRGVDTGLSLGLFLSGVLIVIVMMLSPWTKLSLHAAFAAFAALLLWPLDVWLVALAAGAAAGICWSRVMLGRHTVGEVIAGSALGALLCTGFWFILRIQG